MAAIQSIYFQNMPAHKRPAKIKSEAERNEGIKGSRRDRSGRYALADKAQHFFKRKVLPLIEAARKRGDVVRMHNGVWTINGAPLAL